MLKRSRNWNKLKVTLNPRNSAQTQPSASSQSIQIVFFSFFVANYHSLYQCWPYVRIKFLLKIGICVVIGCLIARAFQVWVEWVYIWSIIAFILPPVCIFAAYCISVYIFPQRKRSPQNMKYSSHVRLTICFNCLEMLLLDYLKYSVYSPAINSFNMY